MVLEKATVAYEGDKYTITIGEKGEMGTFTLDPKKTPKQMDIFPTSGDNNGKTLLAVYQLEGDKLTICYSLTPTVRPGELRAGEQYAAGGEVRAGEGVEGEVIDWG